MTKKILFYFPPYFFRNSYLEYGWILRGIFKYFENNESDLNYKFYCSTPQRKVMEEEVDSDLCKRLFLPEINIGITKAFDSGQLKAYSTEQANSITEFQLGLLTTVKHKWLKTIQDATLNSLYSHFEFDTIATWGNNLHLKNWADPKSVSSVFLELGYLREPSLPTLVIDKQGVNSCSTICSLSEEFFDGNHNSCSSMLAQSIFENHKGTLGSKEKANKIFDGISFIDNFSALSSSDEHSVEASFPNICIYLQLGDDTQVIAGSGFKNMYEYVQYIVPIINQLWSSKCNIFVRFHPAAVSDDARALNALDSLRVMEYIGGISNVFTSHSSWGTAASNCQAIFGINSSSLFETWLYNQSVDIYISGLPGWYPCKTLKANFYKNNSLDKFFYKCSKKVLESVALLSFSGYIHNLENGAKSIIPLLEDFLKYQLRSAKCDDIFLSVSNPSTTLRNIPREAAVSISSESSRFYQLRLNSISFLRLLEEIAQGKDSSRRHLNLEVALNYWLKDEPHLFLQAGISVVDYKIKKDEKVGITIEVARSLAKITPLSIDIYVFSSFDDRCLCKRKCLINKQKLPCSLEFLFPTYKPNLMLNNLLDYHLVFVISSVTHKYVVLESIFL